MPSNGRPAEELNPAITERTPLIPTSATESNARSEVVLDAVTKPVRQVAPDVLRGLLMILMAFDHCNVNFSTFPHGTGVHSEAESQVITEFSKGLGFALRTASHLCASGFALLLGFGLVYFVSSRAQRSWTARAQALHIVKRTVAILVVNFVTFLPATATYHLWMLNVVLPALAFDYVLAGLLVLLLDYSVQPSLERWAGKLQKRASSPTPDSTHSGTNTSRHSSVISWLLDAMLATLFVVATFSTIWTAPNQGRCVTASRPNGNTFNAESMVHDLAAAWLDVPACPLKPSLISRLLLNGVMCPNLGIVSVFPPLAWISFVLLGVGYARIILRLKVNQGGLHALNVGLGIFLGLLFVSTRLLQYGNLSTDCLQTAAQLAHPGKNQYLDDIKSFLYVTKYNPDPAFVFGTSAINFFLLAFFGALFTPSRQATLRGVAEPQGILRRARSALQTVLLTFGVQALFFYAVHQLLFATSLQIVLAIAPGILEPRDPSIYPRDRGLGWPGYFVMYASVMAVSYFLCLWFGRFKARRGPDSVWRFV